MTRHQYMTDAELNEIIDGLFDEPPAVDDDQDMPSDVEFFAKLEGLTMYDEPHSLPLRAVELLNMLECEEDPERREQLRLEIAFLL